MQLCIVDIVRPNLSAAGKQKNISTECKKFKTSSSEKIAYEEPSATEIQSRAFADSPLSSSEIQLKSFSKNSFGTSIAEVTQPTNNYADSTGAYISAEIAESQFCFGNKIIEIWNRIKKVSRIVDPQTSSANESAKINSPDRNRSDSSSFSRSYTNMKDFSQLCSNSRKNSVDVPLSNSYSFQKSLDLLSYLWLALVGLKTEQRKKVSDNQRSVEELCENSSKKSGHTSSGIIAVPQYVLMFFIISKPQVKLGVDGSLILDETSLTVVRGEPENALTIVDEDSVSKKISSMSFRKKAWRRGTPWNDLETDLFYDLIRYIILLISYFEPIILRATGTDFTLMHEFFPSRARSELKSKFNREERTNWRRLSHALSVPTMLDDSLYAKARRVLDLIKKQDEKKREKKLVKKRTNDSNPTEVEWNEDDADLVAEAEKTINEIENPGERIKTHMELNLEKTSGTNLLKKKILDETADEAEKIIKSKKRARNRAELEKMANDSLCMCSAIFIN
ncbi:unnamed protein product [Dracunculus medinensis]|uniref:Myb_DNA-bind_7 domain-containing protein n=1 Tax=Dracunculus medinensis TaxID=318479 RepID=A0A0N4U749_DRAME|nr:unnamed protein product [Dracunculus medinensis]